MNKTCICIVAAIVPVAFLASGCATCLSGTTQNITIVSNPPGAHVQIGAQSGTTPVIMELQKGKDRSVEVTFGRHKQVFTLTRKVDPATFLNIIPPLWPGFIVDAVTGAMTKYDQERITVNFKSAQVARFAH